MKVVIEIALLSDSGKAVEFLTDSVNWRATVLRQDALVLTLSDSFDDNPNSTTSFTPKLADISLVFVVSTPCCSPTVVVICRLKAISSVRVRDTDDCPFNTTVRGARSWLVNWCSHSVVQNRLYCGSSRETSRTYCMLPNKTSIG